MKTEVKNEKQPEAIRCAIALQARSGEAGDCVPNGAQ